VTHLDRMFGIVIVRARSEMGRKRYILRCLFSERCACGAGGASGIVMHLC